jgi:cell division protein FtsB
MSGARDETPDAPTRKQGRRQPRTRQEIQNRHRRVLTYVVLLSSTVLMVNALVGEHGYLAKLRAHRENAALNSELTEIRNENLRLAEQADRLKHDPNAIEEAARNDLSLLKPGEVLVILRDAPTAKVGR